MIFDSVSLEVFRYNPDEDDSNTEGSFTIYEVPYNEDWVVLDALNHIKNHIDGTVSFRWSCRMGVCGSCGMMINGDAKLACAAFLRDYAPNTIRIEPLAHFPIIRDLVIDMDSFMERLDSVSPWILREEEKPLDEGEHLQTPAELASFKQFSMCINCMLCYAACPVTAIENDFVGPAALATAQRYNRDSRDEGFKQRRDAVFSHNAIWDCTFVGECSVVCPKDVDPAAAIQQLKVDATQDWFLSKLMPWKGNK